MMARNTRPIESKTPSTIKAMTKVWPACFDTLLLFEADEPNHAEDIAVTIDAKVDALLCHRSQWRSTMDIAPDAPDVDAAIARFRARVTDDARAEDGGLVERYRLITDL